MLPANIQQCVEKHVSFSTTFHKAREENPQYGSLVRKKEAAALELGCPNTLRNSLSLSWADLPIYTKQPAPL